MSTKGRCAICGEVGKLTDDHVPPRSVVPESAIIVRRLADALDQHAEKREPQPGRIAKVFRTLCKRCNNDLLGSRYDPALARFANDLSVWVRSGFQLFLSLPSVAIIELQPALVARAVIGHLLASEPERSARHEELEGTLPTSMRAYFLSDELAFPPDFQLFVWPYPSTQTVIGRGIGHLDLRGGEPIVADTLKFFPLAFAVVSVEAKMPLIPATRIRPEQAAGMDDTVSLEIPLRGGPGLTWPERPQASSLVLLNRDRVLTIVRPSDRAF